MKALLRDILTEQFIEQFQDSFAFATGFGVVFVDLDGNHIGEGSNFSKFCREINKTEEGASYCANTNRKAIDIAMKTKKPSIYVCHAGLINIEIPLTYEGEYIGAVTAGQVLCSNSDVYPRDGELSIIPWMKTEEAKKYFQSIRTLTKQQIEATAISLQNIANYIVQTAMYNKLQEKLAEERRKTIEYEKRQIEMEHQLKLAELDALQKQVTPHFIFNVISSISRLISMENYSSAKNMLDSFSQMLRYNLSNMTSEITLKQELNYINNYLTIQKHRFAERIEYEIITSDNLLRLKIPYFSLQPLIENAIEHGLLPLENGGKVKMICSETEDSYAIDIIDNGIGMNEEKLKSINQMLKEGASRSVSNHVGLKNCYKRFKLMYGENVTFTLNSTENLGTNLNIEIKK